MLVVPRFTLIKPALPVSADAPPCGPEWVHEIKHDGYRMMGSAGSRRHPAAHPERP
jgi:ATP-dependent DNA ligase